MKKKKERIEARKGREEKETEAEKAREKKIDEQCIMQDV